MDYVLTQHNDAVFEIILNRPDKRNALTVQMLQAVAVATEEAEQTPGVRAIVLRGEGKGFCAGADLASMGGMVKALGENWKQKGYTATRMWQTNIHRLQLSPLPTIALVHGYTLSGGLELALGCDFRIAAENAVLGLEEAQLGIIADAGGTTRLTSLIGPSRTKELLFTGKRIKADVAERWGLVNEVVPKDELQAAGEKWVSEIMSCAPLAVSATKRVINALDDVAQGFHLEMVEQFPLFHTEDTDIAIEARMKRRKPDWQGK
jgi:enoyl-CoA hydratase